ncbi:MAG: hypothetical protein WA441_00870 [Methyloceanibacter sp.]
MGNTNDNSAPSRQANAEHMALGQDKVTADAAKAKRDGVTDEMALREVAIGYLRAAAQKALSRIDRSHLTMAEPCDINSIALSLSYSASNVLQILDTMPPLTRAQSDAAWERLRLNEQAIEELETKLVNQEM